MLGLPDAVQSTCADMFWFLVFKLGAVSTMWRISDNYVPTKGDVEADMVERPEVRA